MGSCFENLFKVIAAKWGLLMTNPDLCFHGRVAKEKGGHGLSGIARSPQLELSPSDKQQLSAF